MVEIKKGENKNFPDFSYCILAFVVNLYHLPDFFENNVFNKIDFDNLKTHYNTLVNPLMIVQWVE